MEGAVKLLDGRCKLPHCREKARFGGNRRGLGHCRITNSAAAVEEDGWRRTLDLRAYSHAFVD